MLSTLGSLSAHDWVHGGVVAQYKAQNIVLKKIS